MNRQSNPVKPPPAAAGGVYAASAFLIWGMSPLFWKMLGAVPAFEILMHRVVWSFASLALLILVLGRWPAFFSGVKDIKTLFFLGLSTCVVAANWFLYIWAVNSAHVLQASLGYYINPLVNVLLGMVFLRERLRLLQGVAVALAAVGVSWLTVSYGQFPWIALTLAFSFGFYGLIRKVVPIGALEGLAVETLLLTLPALAVLIHLNGSGRGAFLHTGFQTDLLLIGSAFLTALPLLLFTRAARRLRLSTLGFFQYIAPSCMFLLGALVYGEPLSAAQMATFVLVWSALGLYSADALLYSRRASPCD